MTTTRTRAAIAAAGAGLLAGITLAVVIPSAEGIPRDGSWATPTNPLVIDTTARGPVPADQATGEVLSEPRIEIRRPDPSGGPDWAVRVFSGRIVTPRYLWRNGKPPRQRPERCAQLVRISGDHIGWVDGKNHFRLVRAESFLDAPSVCTRSGYARQIQPQPQAFTMLDLADDAAPRPLGGVLWGLGGINAVAVRLTTGGETIRPELSERGAYLHLVGPRADLGDAIARVRFEDGRVIDTADPASYGMAVTSSTRKPPVRKQIVPSTARITARTYDPAGGPSWGARSVRTREGKWCRSIAGQIVGTQVGRIDTTFGTYRSKMAGGPSYGCLFGSPRPTAKRPVEWNPFGTYDDTTGATPEGNVLRRPTGRLAFIGWAHPSVRTVTIRTRLTVRTVQPSGPDRSFLVVYDTGTQRGGFPAFTGATLTARLADGTTKTIEAMGPGV